MGRHRNSDWPDYVMAIVEKGDKITKGNSGVYYLSRPAEGSDAGKYNYVGRIIPDGSLIPAKRQNRNHKEAETNATASALFITDYTLSQEIIWEFGFSHFMLTVGYPILRDIVHDDVDHILREIILSISPRSYLQTIDVSSDTKRQISAWKNKLCQALQRKDESLNLTAMYHALNGIVMVETADQQRRISFVSDEQKAIFQRWGVAI